MRIQNLFLTQTKAKTIAQRTSSKQIERTIKLENKARNLNARFKRKSYYRIGRIAQSLENAEQKNSFIKTSRESAKLIMIECEIPKKHWRIILDKVELWAKYNFAGNKTKLKEIERTISNSIGLVSGQERMGRTFVSYLSWATESNWNNVRKNMN